MAAGSPQNLSAPQARKKTCTPGLINHGRDKSAPYEEKEHQEKDKMSIRKRASKPFHQV
jgi:hypothetical protein